MRATLFAVLIALTMTSTADAQRKRVAPPRPSPEQLRNAAATAALPPDQAAMKAHVVFLASDAMAGRNTGSPEFDIAAQYVAAQFFAQGLRPAGDNGSYLQRVPLINYKPADQGSFAVTLKGGERVTLAFGKDYVPAPNPAKAVTTVDAKLAFVGHGIVAPDIKRDDYSGVSVRGRVVLMLNGAPPSLDSEERAHFSQIATKVAIAQAKGAIGVVVIDPSADGIAADAGYYDYTRVGWVERTGAGHSPAPRAPELGSIGPDIAARILGPDWADIADRADDPTARFKPMMLAARLRATTRTASEPMPSANVAGLLPGSDPRLRDEVVVLSAHLDHIGTGKSVDGDTVFNGAMDNAVGVASLIEEARRFKQSGKPPKRSILFLATTAEEKGMVGANYFTHNPVFGSGLTKPRMVANVNLDMPIITYKFEDVIAFGAERSTLGDIVKRAAASIGVGFGPDPLPDEAFFVRSDHYSFVQQGVPSVFLWPGHKGPGAAAAAAFLRDHYHKRSDEIVQDAPIDWEQGVRFVDVNYAIAREIADGAERPRWNKGDFFGLLYRGYGAR